LPIYRAGFDFAALRLTTAHLETHMRTTTDLAYITGIALAVTLITSAGIAAAQSAPIPPTLVANEIDDLRAPRLAFDKFDSQIKVLDAKQRFTTAELEALRQQVEEIKRYVPAIQRSVNGIVTKVKGAGKWTPEFDVWVADLVRRSGRNDIVLGLSEENGARAALQRVLTEIMQVPGQLDGIVAKFKSTTAIERLLDSLLGEPVSAAERADIVKVVFWFMYWATCLKGACAS
jgi:hypothetical protein